MKFETTEELDTLLRMHIASTALGLALELGIFYELEGKELTSNEIANKYNIPTNRTIAWLELLAKLNLLIKRNEKYANSETTIKAIIEPYSRESWAILAREARDLYNICGDLPNNITYPGSLWDKQPTIPPNWLDQIINDPTYARDFTYMLYERHQKFADKLANRLETSNIHRILDVGGGSGVISLALLKKNSNLKAVVIDLENVCIVGEEIARNTPVSDRITYQVADFNRDELPVDFDMVIVCDAGDLESLTFFSKLKLSLKEGGQILVIPNIDDLSAWLNHRTQNPGIQWYMRQFVSSLSSVKTRSTTVQDVMTVLQRAGFREINDDIWEDGTVIIHGLR